MSSILMGMPVLQAGGAGSAATTFITFAGVILIFYLFIIRPQNKKQKETQKMLSALKKFDKVQTIGGIRGVILAVKEQTVVIKVDDNTKIEFVKPAVAAVIESHEAKVSAETEAKIEDKKEDK